MGVERTLSGGDHSAVVSGEEHLRMAVFGDEDLVLPGCRVPRLHHRIAPDRRQVASRHVPQRDTAQLTRRPTSATRTLSVQAKFQRSG